MKDFKTLIASRRSSRQFTKELLSPEQVEAILRAGLMAPTSKNKRPWQFVVVEEKEMLAKLAECKPAGAAFLADCALAIIVMGNVMESDAWIEDCSIASIYMQLQAEDLGLGSCWCQVRGRDREDDGDSATYVRQLFNIPYQMEVLSIIGFGHKAVIRCHKPRLRKERRNDGRLDRCRQLGNPHCFGYASCGYNYFAGI